MRILMFVLNMTVDILNVDFRLEIKGDLKRVTKF